MNAGDSPSKELESNPDINVLSMGVIVEGGLVCVALLFGWFGFFDQQQPLNSIDWQLCRDALIWGCVATVPMLIYLAVTHFWRPAFLQPMRRFVETKLHPMFRGSSLIELLALSLMAGFGEELFFRWCLQGGVTSLLESRIGIAGAIVAGLVIASMVFGGCHWVNASYGVTTIIVGCYLGATMIWTGTWLVPAVAHALFDFVALIYIAKLPLKQS